MNHDLLGRVATVQLLKPQSINDTDTYSSILDTQNFDSAAICVMLGEFTGVDADSTFLASMQESATTADSDFTAVDSADLNGAFTLVDSTSEDAVRQVVGYRGSKRYIRAKLDFTTGSGGISAAIVSVLGLLGNAHANPPSAPAAVTAT